jgi:hypothetical protein
MERRVVRQEDDTHPAAAEWPLDSISAEAGSRLQSDVRFRILCKLIDRYLGCGPGEKVLGARLNFEERCDLSPQHIVASTASLEERVALINRPLKRLVIEARDPLPSVGVHYVKPLLLAW